MWPSLAWSPDGEDLAVAALEDRSGKTEINIHSVRSAGFSATVSIDDLLVAYRTFSDTLSIPDQDRHPVIDSELTQLALWGWSSDGRRLVASAHSIEAGPYGPSSVLLAIIPAPAFEEPGPGLSGEGTPGMLALADAQLYDVSWSPSNPSTLVLSFLSTSAGQQKPQTHLVDVDAGSVRALTNEDAGSVEWSPDGRWLAIGTLSGIIIADGGGRTVLEIPVPGGQCFEVVWSPVADLSDIDGSSE
jgi:hypothetical protein